MRRLKWFTDPHRELGLTEIRKLWQTGGLTAKEIKIVEGQK